MKFLYFEFWNFLNFQIFTQRFYIISCIVPLFDLATDWFSAGKHLIQKNSPFSNALGYAMLINLIIGPVVTGLTQLFNFHAVGPDHWKGQSFHDLKTWNKTLIFLVLFFGTSIDRNLRNSLKVIPKMIVTAFLILFAPLIITIEEVSCIKSNYRKTINARMLKERLNQGILIF